MDLIYELVFIFQQLSAQEVQHPLRGILEGKGEDQLCGMVRIVGNGEKLGFYWEALMGPFAYFPEHWILWGWNQDVTQSCGDTLMCKRRKESFLAHFLF